MDSEVKWKAVTENDRSFDGCFFYAVKSTGIFCRPSCKSKPPLQSNVAYFDTAQQAVDAGYRPCKRCRPDLIRYEPVAETAERVKQAIDRCHHDEDALAEAFSKIGVTQHRMTEIFRARYKLTPKEYADGLRIQEAKARLAAGDESIADIALHLGYDSASAFYGFFRKHAQMAPGEYRRMQLSSGTHADQVYRTYETMLGRMMIASDSGAICAVQFEHMANPRGKQAANALTDQAARQLEEYFAGKRRRFDLPLRPGGTAFQQSVWEALGFIPYGETRSYKQVAQRIGNPGASRAVGMANNKNPIMIVIPCHRVVGSNGALIGYAGGLEIKKTLLALEQTYKNVLEK